MKRKIIFLIILTAAIFANKPALSQCLINPSLILTASNLTLEELFHVDVSCTSNGNYQIYIDVIHNNTLIIKAISSKFQIPDNSISINEFNINILKPFTINNVNGSSVSSSIISGGYFPEGNFNIRYTLYELIGEKITEVSTSTEQIIIPLLMVPQIMLPECNLNSDVEENPIFIWTPAVTSDMNSLISYNFKIVQQNISQSPSVAFYSNAPLIYQPNLPNCYYMKETVDASFVPGNCYAWGVEAVRDGSIIGTSEICTFCIADTANKIKSGRYVDIRNSDMNKTILLYDNYVYIMYFESYTIEPDKTLNIKMFNEEGKEIRLWKQDYPIKKGKNFIAVDICTDRDIKPGQYKLIITNDKNEVFVCKFFKPKDVKCTTINNYK